MSLVLNAAAVCSIFGPRGLRINHLQPPLLLGMKNGFRHNKQRMQLLCCSGTRSILAFRLVRAEGQQGELSAFERMFMPMVVRRCMIEMWCLSHVWRH
jgi:hypothetical protein